MVVGVEMEEEEVEMVEEVVMVEVAKEVEIVVEVADKIVWC